MRKTPTGVKGLLTITALGGLILVVCWLRFSEPPEHSRDPSAPIQTTGLHTASASGTTKTTSIAPEIAAAARSLKSGSDSKDSAQCLGRLRNHLKSLGAEAASVAVQHALDSGADATTQLGFVLSPDGTLKEAPSLRVFLLDYLAQIDPKAAGAYAEKILSVSASPDEWAVSLRAYALANATAEGRTYLQRK